MRALFLDRDGVINVDYGHVCTRENFHFIDGIFDIARTARAAGFELFIVTNQSGIARGLYSEADFLELMSWVCERFEEEGAPIRRVYYCPHHPTEGTLAFRITCECRKPQPGLLLMAQREFQIDMASSVFVGDNVTDMVAGARAGVGTLILLGQKVSDGFRTVSTVGEIVIILKS